MPLTRYRVRSEYGLADPELYRAADKDDPEALLEGVAMAGLVGVLRQLGDLAEFAAEIFHDLHEEVMTTSARGHGLMVRVQQLEAEFPPIEKALLTQPMQSAFFYNAGSDWHPNLRAEQNLISRGDLPRFVMDSYEESRGPPRLFLLDKFDVAGAGACLKRYTNPSFFKVEPAAIEIPREKKNRRVKKKGMRWRNGETTPEVGPMSHTKLHQLFLEERIENGDSDPARLVKLKKRHLNGFVVDSRTGKNYMEKFAETPSDRETPSIPASFTPEYTHESGIRILEISTVSSAEKLTSQSSGSSERSRNGYDEEANDKEMIKLADTCIIDEPFERSSRSNEVEVKKRLTVYGDEKPKVIANGYESDDMGSEVDNYMDALANIESEVETDNEFRPDSSMNFLKAESYRTDNEANDDHLERPAQHSDAQSVGNFSTSDDGNNSSKKNSSRFSYSDSPRSLVENTPSDSNAGSKVFASTDTSEVGISGKATIELSRTADCYNAADSEVLRTVENGTDCVDSESGHSQSSSQIINDFTKISERHLVDELEDEDPNVSHLSNLSELAEEKGRDRSELQGFEIQDELDIASKNALSYENGAPINELPDSLGHSDIVNPDNLHTEVDNSVTDIEVLSEELSPAVDAAKSDLSNQDRSEDIPQFEHTSAEAETRSSNENLDTEVTCKSVDFEEMGSSRCSEGTIDANIGSQQHPTNYISDSGEANNGNLDHKIPETAEVDGGSGSVLPFDAVCSPSESPIVLQEPLISSVVGYQKEVECDEGVSRDADVDIEALGEPQIQNPQICKFAFVDFGLSESVSTSDSHCTPTICDDTGDFPPAEETLNNLSEVNGTMIPTLEDSDSGSPEPEASENSVKSLSDQVGSQYPVTEEVGPRPEILFEQSEVRADQAHEEHTELEQGSMQTSILSSEEMGIGKRDERIESKMSIDQELNGNDSLLSTSISASEEGDHMNEALNPFEPALSSVTTTEASRDDLGDLPPLPPLPPMQWRSLSGIGMGMFPDNPFESNTGYFPSVLPVQEGACQPQHPSSPLSFVEDENAVHHVANDRDNNATSDEPRSLNPFVMLPQISCERETHDDLALEREIAQASSSSFSPAPTSEAMTTENHDVAQIVTREAGLDSKTEGELQKPAVTSEPTASLSGPVRLGLLMPEAETAWLSSNGSGTMPDSEAGKPNGITTNKLPRPRNPLIDAVNAHGKSKLRKVAERVRPHLGPKADERDSMLEQIRTKSFNLKPAAAVTRPSLPGPNPKTNLKVAAILEKANAIRQALAGSDDEDEDNWD